MGIWGRGRADFLAAPQLVRAEQAPHRSPLLVRSDKKHTSVYLPEAVYEALRQVAFDERRKIHDLLMEGVELALKKRG